MRLTSRAIWERNGNGYHILEEIGPRIWSQWILTQDYCSRALRVGSFGVGRPQVRCRLVYLVVAEWTSSPPGTSGHNRCLRGAKREPVAVTGKANSHESHMRRFRRWPGDREP